MSQHEPPMWQSGWAYTQGDIVISPASGQTLARKKPGYSGVHFDRRERKQWQIWTIPTWEPGTIPSGTPEAANGLARD